LTGIEELEALLRVLEETENIQINILEGINVLKVTPEEKVMFLSVLAEGGSVTCKSNWHSA
jgi:hypothetical protein